MVRHRGSPQWAWRLPGGREPAVYAGIEDLEADALRELATDKTVLEIGSAYGYSTIVMAQVAKSVVAIDPMTQFDSWKVFHDNVEAHGVAAKVSLLVLRSEIALPALYKAGEWYDLIFIDGDHLPESVRHDLAWARRLVRLGGVIALHDYLLGPGTFVRPAAQEWREPDRLVETLGIYVDVEPVAGERVAASPGS